MYKLNEDLFDDIINNIPDVNTEVVTDNDIQPEGPQEGVDNGIANILHDLIIDEHEAIQGYNNAIANLETRPELKPILQDIANEEMNHIGMLEVALSLLSPNVSNIEEGEVEAENELQTEFDNRLIFHEELRYNDPVKLLNVITGAVINYFSDLKNKGDFEISETSKENLIEELNTVLSSKSTSKKNTEGIYIRNSITVFTAISKVVTDFFTLHNIPENKTSPDVLIDIIQKDLYTNMDKRK